MKYQENKTKLVNEGKNHFVSSCLKCNSDDLKISEYEDEYGYITTISCKKCKREIKLGTSVLHTIKKWNNENHIPTLIKNKKSLIKTTEKEIVKLQKKLKLTNHPQG